MPNSTKAIIAFITFLLVFGLTLGFTMRAHADDSALYKALDSGLNAATNQPTQTIQEGLEAEVAQAKSNYEFRTGQHRICPPLIQKTRPPVITAKQIYWITRLDPLNGALTGICVIPGILSIISLVMFCCGKVEDETDRPYFRLGRAGLVLNLFLFLTGIAGIVFIPSTKEMAMIQITPVIVNSDFIQEDLPREAKELYGLAKSYFQEAVEKK
jgi:hypothetical protein